MKFLILTENSRGSWNFTHYRSLGAQELKKRIKKAGYQAHIIEWFSYWDQRLLIQVFSEFFKDTDQPVIALSTTFDNDNISYIENTLLWAKNNIKNLQIILGGNRVVTGAYNHLADIIFLGRSMQMFDDFLNKRDLSQYKIADNPTVLMNKNFDERIDRPVIPTLDDDDFYHSKDVLGFEIGVGCKFNCSFCNYELRNSKITKVLDPKELHEYFDEAYKKYGVQHYYTSDDTINETDQKLETIVEAMEGLDYKPKIATFARLDMVGARKAQLHLFSRINFGSVFFGIESLNPEASKAIRKKSSLDNTYQILQNIRNKSPDTFIIGSLLIGLNGDSKQSIISGVEKIIQEKLLDSILVFPLNMYKGQHIADEYFLSDLEKDPESFNYKVLDTFEDLHPNTLTKMKYSWKGGHEMDKFKIHWQSDWTDFLGAELFTQELVKMFPATTNLGHLEYIGYKAQGVLQNRHNLKTRDILNRKAKVVSTLQKTEYINKKLAYFGIKR